MTRNSLLEMLSGITIAGDNPHVMICVDSGSGEVLMAIEDVMVGFGHPYAEGSSAAPLLPYIVLRASRRSEHA